MFSQILFLRCCVTVCKASSVFHYIQNTYYRYLYSSYIFTSSLFSKSTRYVAHARHLPDVIGNLVFLHSFQLAVVFYVLRSGSIIYLCGIPACTLPSTMINCGLDGCHTLCFTNMGLWPVFAYTLPFTIVNCSQGFHYPHYSTSSTTLHTTVLCYLLKTFRLLFISVMR
ncbi:uncharacterized protein LOC126927918 isoform X1 [Bombus affinis]|uniref:uncharacterized protein LOC126927918 isoform X1 n=1 Tax=Bombus affinis TaxID=309941 RepID=UPI0021B7A331|nr:uncharacterized protein LOC126927918 isoform X1 [Bombus affinis]